MNTETRAALEGSIKKWQGIVDGTEIDKGHYNCPLCEMFFANQSCGSCPVRKKTEVELCYGTPYRAFEAFSSKFPGHDSAFLDEWQSESKRLAQAELDFLISLRED